MAVAGWIADKSASARAREPSIAAQLAEISGPLCICPMGELEQLFSAHSAAEYDELADGFEKRFSQVDAPPDILRRVLALQRDLAHHHGMWHRTAIPDLIIAETALYHSLGVLHVDRDFERIAEVRPLTVRRLGRE